jgi:hypothetical protein
VRQEALQEYYWIQERVVQYESRRFQVKSWSITASGVGFATAVLESAPSLLLISAAGALVFWYIEASLRAAQNLVAGRGRSLEVALQTNAFETPSPAFFRHKAENDGWFARLLRIARGTAYVSVMLPHALIVFVASLLFLDAAGLLGLGIWRAVFVLSGEGP